MKQIIIVLAATLLVASCVTERKALDKLRPQLPQICGDMFPPRDCVIVIVGPDYKEEMENIKRAKDSVVKMISSLPQTLRYNDSIGQWVIEGGGEEPVVFFDTCKDKKTIAVPSDRVQRLLQRNRELQQKTAEFIYIIDDLDEKLRNQRDSTIKIFRANTAKERFLQDALVVADYRNKKYLKFIFVLSALVLLMLLYIIYLKRK